MKITVLENEILVGKYLANDLAKLVNSNPGILVSLAAGHSSLEMFNEMIFLQNSGKADFRKAYYAGLDEWKGFSKADDGSCAGFLHKNLFDPLGIDLNHIHLFNGNYYDFETEADLMYKFIDNHGGISYILLGIGMNGHIGLNEPGTPFDYGISEVRIDPVTQTVGQKYFKNSTELEFGITLGIKDILKVPKIVLTAQSSRKRDIFKTFLETSPDPCIPATALKLSTDLEVVTDKAASSH